MNVEERWSIYSYNKTLDLKLGNLKMLCSPACMRFILSAYIIWAWCAHITSVPLTWHDGIQGHKIVLKNFQKY